MLRIVKVSNPLMRWGGAGHACARQLDGHRIPASDFGPQPLLFDTHVAWCRAVDGDDRREVHRRTTEQ